jgi:hypothetical protein
MAITIHLDNPKPVYHPGDNISGIVRLVADSTNIPEIKISLSGIAYTHLIFVRYISGTSNFSKKVQLFSRELTLFKGPYTLSGKHEWRFEFIIPTSCEADESQSFEDKRSPLFNDNPNQNLPPSVELVQSSKFRTSGNSLRISYPLTVTSGKKTQTIEINIQPYREGYSGWSIQTHLCDFTDFQLIAKVATNIIVGKPIPLFLTLEQKSEIQTFIKSIQVSLEIDNIIRCQGSSGQYPYYSGAPESLWTITKLIGSKNEKFPMENGEIDVRTLIPDLIIFETPSFASFSIVRVHELRVKVELESNDKNFTASYKVKKIFLLPEYQQPGEDIDYLPAYGELEY